MLCQQEQTQTVRTCACVRRRKCARACAWRERGRRRGRRPCPRGTPRLGSEAAELPVGRQPHPLTQSGTPPRPPRSSSGTVPGQCQDRCHVPSPHPPLTSLQEPHRHLPSARSRNPMTPLGPPSPAIVTHNPFRAHAHRPTLSTTHPRTSQSRPEPPRYCSRRSGNTEGAPEAPQLPEPGPTASRTRAQLLGAEASRPALRHPASLCSQLDKGTPSLGPSHVSSPAQPLPLLPAWPQMLPHHGRHVAPDVVSYQVPTGPHSSGQR